MVSSIATSPAIDLSKLPPPTLVPQPSHETRFQAKLAEMIALIPDFSALVESDPAIKLLQADAYDELVLAQSFNDAAKQLLIAFATDANLDQLGALYGVARLELTPANLLTGAPAIMESDHELRGRILLAPHSFSVAGPEMAYVYHALSASGDVLDASATSPEPDDIQGLILCVLAAHSAAPALVSAITHALDAADWPGDVRIAVLSRTGTGLAPPATVAAVTALLTDDSVRPLTDHVIVQSAAIIHFTIDADLWLYAGPDASLIQTTAAARLDEYLAGVRRLGRDVTRSGITAALHTGGVQRVVLTSPANDVTVTKLEAGHCTAIDISIAGTAE